MKTAEDVVEWLRNKAASDFPYTMRFARMRKDEDIVRQVLNIVAFMIEKEIVRGE